MDGHPIQVSCQGFQSLTEGTVASSFNLIMKDRWSSSKYQNLRGYGSNYCYNYLPMAASTFKATLNARADQKWNHGKKMTKPLSLSEALCVHANTSVISSSGNAGASAVSES